MRRLAEEIVQKKVASLREDIENLPPEEIRRIFHELRVHQIELEMQNIQLREAQAALEGSQARYFDLYDMAPVGYCTVSKEGLIQEVNLKAATMLGLTRMRLVGQPISPRFIHKEDRGDYYLLHNRLFETGAPQACELRMVQWDRTTFWAYLSTSLAQDEDGSSQCRVALTDITKRKRAEEQLQYLNDELEQIVEKRSRELGEAQSQYLHAVKLSAIGQLAASIAHEFNNPLQGLRTILKGLKRRAILEEEDRELLNLAINENERMKNLIKSLQDFNRPSTGQKTAMDVHAALDYLLLLYKSDFKRKRISAVRKYAEGFPPITVIPDQLKQVFLNLLNNAADACSENGGSITITTYHDNQKVVIEIEDTGVGIENEMKNKIFEPFFTTKTKEKGTGLGLSICRDIIEYHQGEIHVESEPGKGSTFTILLPAI
ncbi:MAG: nitrogen regulation protein NR(II) [Desulfopila sp.]